MAPTQPTPDIVGVNPLGKTSEVTKKRQSKNQATLSIYFSRNVNPPFSGIRKARPISTSSRRNAGREKGGYATSGPNRIVPPRSPQSNAGEGDEDTDPVGAGRAVSSSDEQQEQGEFKFTIAEQIGDVFKAPPKTILVHACNCYGNWGSGIAATFAEKYPEANKVYKRHCLKYPPQKLRGTALLIPPQPKDSPNHYIGCIFTSVATGTRKDPPKMILKSTETSMKDLIKQINGLPENAGIGEIWMPEINSGLFNVNWESTKAVLAGLRFKAAVPKLVVKRKPQQ